MRATAGDNRLGSDDFSGVLMERLMAAVGKAAGLPPLRVNCVFRRKPAGDSGLSRSLCGVWRR
jgi:hypothetical protein